jgi:hypothetical protein
MLRKIIGHVNLERGIDIPRELSDEEARELGVVTLHQLMDNGERRFRLISSDGTSYIRTEASSEGGWQNSHFHKQLTELYIVQSGWLVYAELSAEGKLSLRMMKQGDSIVVNPFIHHNLYMSSYTVTHVVKYGANVIQSDWFPSSELDSLTKLIPESELLTIGGLA